MTRKKPSPPKKRNPHALDALMRRAPVMKDRRKQRGGAGSERVDEDEHKPEDDR